MAGRAASRRVAGRVNRRLSAWPPDDGAGRAVSAEHRAEGAPADTGHRRVVGRVRQKGERECKRPAASSRPGCVVDPRFVRRAVAGAQARVLGRRQQHPRGCQIGGRVARGDVPKSMIALSRPWWTSMLAGCRSPCSHTGRPVQRGTPSASRQWCAAAVPSIVPSSSAMRATVAASRAASGTPRTGLIGWSAGAAVCRLPRNLPSRSAAAPSQPVAYGRRCRRAGAGARSIPTDSRGPGGRRAPAPESGAGAGGRVREAISVRAAPAARHVRGVASGPIVRRPAGTSRCPIRTPAWPAAGRRGRGAARPAACGPGAR
jgi:hypothetical protein